MFIGHPLAWACSPSLEMGFPRSGVIGPLTWGSSWWIWYLNLQNNAGLINGSKKSVTNGAEVDLDDPVVLCPLVGFQKDVLELLSLLGDIYRMEKQFISN